MGNFTVTVANGEATLTRKGKGLTVVTHAGPVPDLPGPQAEQLDEASASDAPRPSRPKAAEK